MNEFRAALADEQAGRWRQAHDRYAAIVARDASNAPALHRLGLTAFHLGRPAAALDWLQKALALGPQADLLLDYASVLQECQQWAPAAASFAAALRLAPQSVDGSFGLAVCLHQSGRLAEAARAYQIMLAKRPDIAVAHENLGRVRLGLAQPGPAAAALRRAAQLGANTPGLWNALGAALHLAGQGGAAAAFRAALRLDPHLAEAWRNLRMVLEADGQPDAAVARRLAAQRLAALCPDDADALNAVGLAAARHGDDDAAARAYAAAWRADPRLSAPAGNLVETLLRLGRRDAAREILRILLARDPGDATARRLAGRLLAGELRHDAALRALQDAAACAPADPALLTDLGGAALRARRGDIAAAVYARLLVLVPDHPAALGHLTELQLLACDWPAAAVSGRRLLDRLRCGAADGVPPFVLLGLDGATAADQLCAATAWAGQKAAGVAPARRPILPASNNDGRIRIGYLSSDFREHAIACLLAGVLEAHDRRRFAIHAYSIGPDDGGAMRRRIAAGVEHFIDLKDMGDGAAAQRIADDRIDILVDVNGYTAFARTAIVAARPAPIQVNWLGYPGTLGAGFIDHIIADPQLIQPGEEGDYREAVVRLPHCYQPNDRRRVIAGDPPDRAVWGLPGDGVVFCCFNNLYKITAPVFAIWLHILRATPGSALWLLEGAPGAMANLRRAAAAGGVAVDRLVFAPLVPPPRHLARHRCADLFLDTLPYNAHTTGSDALWAGLPVLTRRGPTFAGRVGASLLTAAGLPELITDTPEAYAALAIDLANDNMRLTALKQRLAAQRLTCPLFDDASFARHLEAAFAAMYEAAFAAMHEARRQGAPPRPITIPSQTGDRKTP